MDYSRFQFGSVTYFFTPLCLTELYLFALEGPAYNSLRQPWESPIICLKKKVRNQKRERRHPGTGRVGVHIQNLYQKSGKETISNKLWSTIAIQTGTLIFYYSLMELRRLNYDKIAIVFHNDCCIKSNDMSSGSKITVWIHWNQNSVCVCVCAHMRWNRFDT